MNPAREVKTGRFSRTEGKTAAFVASTGHPINRYNAGLLFESGLHLKIILHNIVDNYFINMYYRLLQQYNRPIKGPIERMNECLSSLFYPAGVLLSRKWQRGREAVSKFWMFCPSGTGF